MIPVVVALSVLAASPQGPIRIAAPGLSMVNADAEKADFYTSHLAQLLNYEGVQVLTSTDVTSVLGLERQRQLLGCQDDACKAALSVDLGVDGLLVGQVVKLEREYKLDVKVLEPGTGRALAAASVSSADHDRFVNTFLLVANQVAAQLSSRLGKPLVPQDTTVIHQWSTVKRLSFLPAALGVGAAVVGGIGLGMSRGTYAELTRAGRDPAAVAGSPNGPLTPEQADSLVRTGNNQQTFGWVGIGVGAGLLATAAGMFAFGGDEVVSAGVAVAPGSASVGFAGVW